MQDKRDSAHGEAMPKTRQECQAVASDLYVLVLGLRGLIFAGQHSEQAEQIKDSQAALLPMADLVMTKAEALVENLYRVKS